MRIELFRAKIMIIVALVLLSPYVSFMIKGGDSFLSIFDGLDSNHVNLKVSADNYHNLNDVSSFPQPVGGVPLHKDLIPSLQSLLFRTFSPLAADVINRIIISLVAFISMLLLLSQLNPKINSDKLEWLWAVGLSLAYALCRYWPYAGISVAGLPLVFYAYLRADRKTLISILLAMFYAWYSSLALVGMFLIAVLCILELIQLASHKGSMKRILLIISLAISYIFFNYAMVISVIDPLFVSHRAEFNLVATYPSVKEAAIFAWQTFMFNAGHNGGFPTLIIISYLLSGIALFIKTRKIPKLSLYFFAAYILLIIISFVFNNQLTVAYQQKIPVLSMLQLQRFYWLVLPIQYILFYYALKAIRGLGWKRLAIFILFLQVGLLFYKINYNTKQMIKPLIGKSTPIPNYNEFYSQNLMREIRDYIDKPQNSYRVGSVGLYPAIALYNGFYTVDGYYSEGYPLEHKHKMAQVLEKELAKNETLWSTFHDWGSVCYLFSDDIDRKIGYNGGYAPPIIRKTDNVVIDDLQLNTSLLQEMNCQYIMSALQIKNAQNIGLSLERTFEREDSPYRIYLYKITATDNHKYELTRIINE